MQRNDRAAHWQWNSRRPAAGRQPAKESSRLPVIFDAAREWIGPEHTDKPDLYRQGPAGAKVVGMMGWAAMERHKDGVNVLFQGSHAENVPVPELWKLKWLETFEPREVER